MRLLIGFVMLLPGSSWADTLLMNSQVTAVTIYMNGAQVTREVVFEAPAGAHDLLITDLPAGIDPRRLRRASSDTAFGAFSLRSDHFPPRDAQTPPELDAAKTAEKAAQADLRLVEAKVAGIDAEIEAQEAQIKFLGAITMKDSGVTAEALFAVAQMIGTEVLTSRMAALAAQGGRAVADDAVTEAQGNLTAAKDALAAVSQADQEYVALSVAVTGRAARASDGDLVCGGRFLVAGLRSFAGPQGRPENDGSRGSGQPKQWGRLGGCRTDLVNCAAHRAIGTHRS